MAEICYECFSFHNRNLLHLHQSLILRNTFSQHLLSTGHNRSDELRGRACQPLVSFSEAARKTIEEYLPAKVLPGGPFF